MGQPVAYGVGFLVLVFVGVARILQRILLAYAHEGGHVLMVVATFRRLVGFVLEDNGDGETRWFGGAISNFLIRLVGYATPPLLGLGGASLIARGNTLAVLLITILLSFAALVPARNPLAVTVPVVVIVGLVLVLLRGSPFLQAGVAVGVVWFLLISGADENLSFRGRKTDAALLAGSTMVIPAVVWELLWAAVALVALVAGGRLLLVPDVA